MMMVLRCGLAALALLAAVATAQPARTQHSCDGSFWDGVEWVCWTHPLFPGLSLAPNANPWWRWTQNWGGTNWRFQGWQPR
jgi:disulfide bond formation protein DsbB